MNADWAWRQWYWALDLYFPSPLEPRHVDFDFSSAVQSCGWAGIILLSFAPITNWLLWCVCILAVAGALVTQIFYAIGYLSSRSSVSFQLASMLRELRSADATNRSPEDVQKRMTATAGNTE